MTRRLKVALEVWSPDFEQVRATCLLAEQLGFDAFYYGESPHDLNLECWSTLAALAQATSSIRLGPVIANVLPSFRSHHLLVRQVAAVDAISGGRVDFRTGVGANRAFGRAWWEPAGVDYPEYEQRLDDLATALDLFESIRPTLPVTLAATGPRAMSLAAAQAGTWETSFCTPEEFTIRDRAMRDLLQERSVIRSLEIDGFLARTQSDLNRLLDQVRTDRGDVEELEPIFDRALVGTPDQAAGRLAALHTAGVDQVVVALHDPHHPPALDALAETVSQFRSRFESRS